MFLYQGKTFNDFMCGFLLQFLSLSSSFFRLSRFVYFYENVQKVIINLNLQHAKNVLIDIKVKCINENEKKSTNALLACHVQLITCFFCFFSANFHLQTHYDCIKFCCMQINFRDNEMFLMSLIGWGWVMSRHSLWQELLDL